MTRKHGRKSARKKPKQKPIEQRIVQRLNEKAALFDGRSKVYGRNYMTFGGAMKAIFPHGITLKTEEDFVRFGLFTQMIGKATRYGHSFAKGHADSLDDTCVYSQILAEVDRELIH